MVLRQKDDNSERWTSAADDTLDRRIYYCQNWRSDVVALIGAGGKMKEWVKYTSYGVAMALPAGDTDSDFDCDATDISNIDNWPGGYDVRYDLDLDGDVDSTDSSIASSNYQGVTLGWNVLSNPAIDNVRGYAGYRWKQNTSKYEVRHRVYDPHLGRWTRRDPLGYVDGMSLYEYVNSRAIMLCDPSGLVPSDCLVCFLRCMLIPAIPLAPSMTPFCATMISACQAGVLPACPGAIACAVALGFATYGCLETCCPGWHDGSPSPYNPYHRHNFHPYDREVPDGPRIGI